MNPCKHLADHYCLGNDLATYDHYDIWSSPVGFRVKKFYNRNRLFALPLAAALTLFDRFNHRHVFYRKHDYPIVRAMAVMVLLRLWRESGDERYLRKAQESLEWLVRHTGQAPHGIGWGVLLPRAVSRSVVYPAEMTFSTITPYALEAFVEYRRMTGDHAYDGILQGIGEYFTESIPIVFEDAECAATAYGTVPDRIVFNAVSYSMFCNALLHEQNLASRSPEMIGKLCRFIMKYQREDGSWLYNYDDPGSFIDCFHSCFVLKNLIKASRLLPLPGARESAERGWEYVKKSMFHPEDALFRRFAIANKPGIVKYDLYDNAEALNVAILLDDRPMIRGLEESIRRHFVNGETVFSRIDFSGRRYAPDYLKWAVMPYLLALSKLPQEYCHE